MKKIDFTRHSKISSFNKNIRAIRSFAMAFLNLFKIYPLMKMGFLTNKYTLSVFILLAILATDVLLHRGMSRVILPENFTNKIQPYAQLPGCTNNLELRDKQWAKAINTVAAAMQIDSSLAGFEMDVYFDTLNNNFLVYHDSSLMASTTAGEIFEIVQKRKLNSAIWMDLKNLQDYNKTAALHQLLYLENKYQLHNKLLVESQNVTALKAFCDSGFYTSYYVPFFNPYIEKEDILVNWVDSISTVLKNNPVSALSGYYFQIPFLKKFFPAFPLLTWTTDSKISLVNNLFNYQLKNDDQVRIILHNSDN